MNFIKQKERLEQMDQLIRLKSTGSPTIFAKRIGVSESTLFLLLGLMKKLGAGVNFCDCHQSYVYEEDVKLNVGFEKVG